MTDRVPEPPALFQRLESPPLVGLLTPDDRNMIRTAYIFAKYGHRWQVRMQGGRYVDHPKGVALILLDELGIIDPVLIAVGLLHDCPEDTRDVDVTLIEFALGSEVARLALQVSKLPKEGFYERLAVFGDPRALLVKGADRLDNLRTLPVGDRVFAEKQYRQTSTEFLPLLDRLRETAPPLYDRAAVKLDGLIRAELLTIEQGLGHEPG